MSDLISKSALLEDIDYFISHTQEDSGEHYAYKQCKKLIERQPLVEPVRGEWQPYTISNLFTHTCTACHCDVKEKTPFCPHCGADMRKKVE